MLDICHMLKIACNALAEMERFYIDLWQDKIYLMKLLCSKGNYSLNCIQHFPECDVMFIRTVPVQVRWKRRLSRFKNIMIAIDVVDNAHKRAVCYIMSVSKCMKYSTLTKWAILMTSTGHVKN